LLQQGFLSLPVATRSHRGEWTKQNGWRKNPALSGPVLSLAEGVEWVALSTAFVLTAKLFVFEHLNFGYSDLFRISIFGFRIFPLCLRALGPYLS
jgi:hypothetical protein